MRVHLDELDKVAAAILKDDFKGVVLLKGVVGSGKTTLVQACLKHLGLDIQATSPTFSLMHAYSESVFHYDFYMRDLEACLDLGMLECLLEKGIHFVFMGVENKGVVVERLKKDLQLNAQEIACVGDDYNDLG
ncbi:tRNA (adenosine(37)-N6)-threonylcarbamoyltransferase complex ATPase subunit type 1 TsaE, partial [Helicobacter pylori]|uniref:tRNA (adenosine(37)-N6)-threonylcarbamoyltransferase complex ATPase subunit type 1 TsaE n=1 Tax=Helicobacter pylori TaxID=210 RepID=UPI001F5121B3